MSNLIKETIINLEKERNSLQEEIQTLDSTIDILRRRLNKPNKNEDLYTKTTISKKITLAITNENRFLHSREIAKIIGVKTEKLSSPISILGRQGRLAKHTYGKILRNTFWGLPDWVDDNNEIKAPHDFDKTFLVKTPVEWIEI